MYLLDFYNIIIHFIEVINIFFCSFYNFVRNIIILSYFFFYIIFYGSNGIFGKLSKLFQISESPNIWKVADRNEKSIIRTERITNILKILDIRSVLTPTC